MIIIITIMTLLYFNNYANYVSNQTINGARVVCTAASWLTKVYICFSS